MITEFSLYQGTNPVDITIFISIADGDVIEDQSIPQSTHTATFVCVEDMLVVSWLLKNCVHCVRSGLEVFHLLDCLQLNELLYKVNDFVVYYIKSRTAIYPQISFPFTFVHFVHLLYIWFTFKLKYVYFLIWRIKLLC